MSLWSDIGKLRQILAIRSQLQEAGKMGKLKAVGFALAGAIATGVMAQVTGACPGLIGAAPAIVTAALGGIMTYWMRKPLTSAAGKATLAGCGAFALATVVEQVKQVCGGDFVQQLPTLAVAGLWVGVGLWLKAPHEQPGNVTSPDLRG